MMHVVLGQSGYVIQLSEEVEYLPQEETTGLVTLCLNKSIVIAGMDRVQVNLPYRLIGRWNQVVDCVPSRDILVHLKVQRTGQIVAVTQNISRDAKVIIAERSVCVV